MNKLELVTTNIASIDHEDWLLILRALMRMEMSEHSIELVGKIKSIADLTEPKAIKSARLSYEF